MARIELQIGTDEGLHARPAAEFVKIASASSAVVKVSRPGSKSVDGKSMLGVLSLGLKAQEWVLIEASGDQETELLERLASVVKGVSNH